MHTKGGKKWKFRLRKLVKTDIPPSGKQHSKVLEIFILDLQPWNIAVISFPITMKTLFHALPGTRLSILKLQTPSCLPKSLSPPPFWSLAQLLLPSHFFPTNTDLTLDLQLNNIHDLIILDVNLAVPERTNYWYREKKKNSSPWTVLPGHRGSKLDNNPASFPY